MTIPAFWTRLLILMGVAKAAVAGAGLAVALLGATDLAFAITARDFIDTMKPHFLDYTALGGGVVGASLATVRALFFR